MAGSQLSMNDKCKIR